MSLTSFFRIYQPYQQGQLPVAVYIVIIRQQCDELNGKGLRIYHDYISVTS